MHTLRIILLIATFLANPFHAAVQSSDNDFSISLSRDFGYGGLDGKIQGTFSVRASGPDDLERVEFLIDDQIVFNDNEAPFQYQFHTSDYELGDRRFAARGYTLDGRILKSNEFVRNFISSEEGWGTTVKIVVPLLIAVAVFSLVGALLPAFFRRRRGVFQVGEYGAAGGAICPRCELPYTRHFISPNLIFGKLERCPHCMKLALVARATPAELEAAEARWKVETEHSRQIEDEETRFQRLLDDSRFEE